MRNERRVARGALHPIRPLNTRRSLLAARCLALLLGLLALGVLAGCGAEPTPIPPVPTATTAPAQATATSMVVELHTAVATASGAAVLPGGPATVGTGGGDQPLPTTSPGKVAKPTGPPGKLTLPTPVPTAPGQELPNPEGTAGPSGDDVLPLVNVDVGNIAPDFRLTRLDTGAEVRLSDFKGRPVWINFWATWCGPCKQEMPQMQAVYQAHKDSDLVILGVDFKEDPALVRQFVTDGKFDWTFALDSDGRAALSYFVPGIPTHVFVARDGTIRDIITSGLDHTRMEQKVAALLAK